MNALRQILATLLTWGLAIVTQEAMAVDYMGYYGNAVPNPPNPRTNTAMIGWTSASQTVQQINELPTETSVVLAVTGLFFNGTTLLDYSANWSALATALKTSVPSGKVVAFYLYDEVNFYKPSSNDLSTVIAAIHKDFPYPGTAVMTALSPGFLWSPYAQLYDWIGFDCYSNGSLQCNPGATGPNQNNLSGAYINTYNSLKSLLKSGGRMFLVPQVSEPTGGGYDAALEEENQQLLHLAYSDPTIVGIVPFEWENCSACATQGGTGPNVVVGLNGLPGLWPTLNQIGNTVEFLHQYSLGWRYPGMNAVFLDGNHADSEQYFVWSPGGCPWTCATFTFVSMSGLEFFLYSKTQPGTQPVYDCTTVRHGAHGSGTFLSNSLSTTSTCANVGLLSGTATLLGYALTSSVSGSTAISVPISTTSAITLYAPPVTVP